jgi:hypothetical protein
LEGTEEVKKEAAKRASSLKAKEAKESPLDSGWVVPLENILFLEFSPAPGIDYAGMLTIFIKR